jgi:SAM-dependent methyltransferase
MTGNVANVEMAAAWDGDDGDEWARDWQRYDSAVADHHATLLAAAAVGASERVLDVGCGNGQATRDAARAASEGEALGVDLSSQMIDRARELAVAEGVANARFERADAQVHPFAASTYDAVISRFGSMFFADPVAAFSNIGAALRPGGRLVMIVWRPVAENEWLSGIFSALADGRDLPMPRNGAPGPAGLADPDQTRDRLAAAGFAGIDISAVDHPVRLGTNGDDAYDFFRQTGVVRGMTGGLDPAGRDRALGALHAMMTEHETADGVQFQSACWLVQARRPPP